MLWFGQQQDTATAMLVDFQELARRMLADYDARTPGQLFAEARDLTTVQAYALQAEIARLREQRGEKVIGYKIGCASRAIQQQLGIQEPIFGRIFDTGGFASGVRLSHARFANLAIEGELAVRLATNLSDSPRLDENDRDAIESIFPVIELHDYRLSSSPPCCQELIARNGLHAGFVVGEPPHGGPSDRLRRLAILVNDRRIDESGEPWTMDGPIASLRWLAARLEKCGLRLSRGQVILTGSALPLYPVGPHSRVVVEAPPLGRSCVEIDS